MSSSCVQERFSADGYVWEKQVVPACVIESWKDFTTVVVEQIFAALHKRRDVLESDKTDIMKVGIKHGFREIVMRSPGRYEITLKESSKFLQISNMPSLQELQSFLPFEQSWHADGGHVDLQHHQPCHCLNIFIPLLDLTSDLGPTELRPGTHLHTRNLVPLMLAAKARKTLQAPTTPLLQCGDVLVFDYRILHRGLANVSQQNRPILVLTVAQAWFKDVLNFPARSLKDHNRSESKE